MCVRAAFVCRQEASFDRHTLRNAPASQEVHVMGYHCSTRKNGDKYTKSDMLK
jgi:hypothetical protein